MGVIATYVVTAAAVLSLCAYTGSVLGDILSAYLERWLSGDR